MGNEYEMKPKTKCMSDQSLPTPTSIKQTALYMRFVVQRITKLHVICHYYKNVLVFVWCGKMKLFECVLLTRAFCGGQGATINMRETPRVSGRGEMYGFVNHPSSVFNLFIIFYIEAKMLQFMSFEWLFQC